jgi:hypothetical protein
MRKDGDDFTTVFTDSPPQVYHLKEETRGHLSNVLLDLSNTKETGKRSYLTTG